MECIRERLQEIHDLQAIGMPREGTAEALGYFTDEQDEVYRLTDLRHGRCGACAVAAWAYKLNNGEWMIIQDLIGVKDYTPDWQCPAEQARALEAAAEAAIKETLTDSPSLPGIIGFA